MKIDPEFSYLFSLKFQIAFMLAILHNCSIRIKLIIVAFTMRVLANVCDELSSIILPISKFILTVDHFHVSSTISIL